MRGQRLSACKSFHPTEQNTLHFSAAKRPCPGSGYPFQIHMWRVCNVYGWIMEHSIISRGPTFRQRVSSRNAPFHQPETTFETRSLFFANAGWAGAREIHRADCIIHAGAFVSPCCALARPRARMDRGCALSVPVCKPPNAAWSHCLDKTKANCVCTRSWLRQPPIDWIDTC